MKLHLLLFISPLIFLGTVCGIAQVGDAKATPEVKNVITEEGAVTAVHLSPGYTTSVRLDEYFRKAGFDVNHSRIACFLGLCKRVIDLPRHLGQHSGGMVISQRALDSVVPLEPASMPNSVVVQWDKDDCAALGIVQVDLLEL